jgi:hypothetical protein
MVTISKLLVSANARKAKYISQGLYTLRDVVIWIEVRKQLLSLLIRKR